MNSLQEFQTEFWLPVSIDLVWDFFQDPKNLVTLSPSYLNLVVDGDPKTKEGEQFALHMNPFKLPLKLTWISKIKDVQISDMDRSFMDVQIEGPFKFWEHTHRFEKGKKTLGSATMLEPGTWVKDFVRYELRYDLHGIVNCFVMRRMLAKMFLQRQKALKEHFKVSLS